MSDPLLTQCPHCETTFRITHEHLQIAGGAVRCGACYQVFHAGEHIVEASSADSDDAPAPAVTRTPTPSFSASDDDFQLDEFDDAAELEPPVSRRPTSAAQTPGPTPAKAAGRGQGTPMRATDNFDDFDASDLDGMEDFGSSRLDDDDFDPKKPAKDSEDWARALLLELGEPLDDEDEPPPPPRQTHKTPASAAPTKTAPTARTGRDSQSAGPLTNPLAPPGETGRAYAQAPARLEDDLSDTFKSVGTQDSHDPFRMDGSSKDDEPDNDPEGWAKAILEDEGSDRGGRPQRQAREPDRNSTRQSPAAASRPAAAPAPAGDDFLEGFDLADIEQDLGSLSNKPRTIEDIDLGDAASAMHTLELIPDEPRHKSKQGVVATPAKANKSPAAPAPASRPRIERASRTTTSSARPLWVGGIILILVALGASLGTVNFQQWSREPNLRPVYQAACDLLACQLPDQADTTRIHANKLVVRTHPTIPNALSVDTLMINEASYPQPFPLLELTFEDINGNLVARSTFRPDQYIRDPGIDVRKMPPRTPFHVGLELRDPGRGAANYHLRFLPVTDATP